LSFLRCEVVARAHAALAGGLAGGLELAASALGEGLRPEATERSVGGAEMFARLHAASFATQPFAVDKACAGGMNGHPGAIEPLDRLAI
jgi:hypothetical protein